jgi:hypothetical protein
MLMIRTYSSKTTHGWLAAVVALALAPLIVVVPAPAQEVASATGKREAASAIDTWLCKIDGGDYAESWTDAAKSFQAAVSSDKWVEALNQVRVPLGNVLDRKLASSLYQTDAPFGGTTIQGPFVIEQFTSSFENLHAAVETVTFEKEADGVWRACGYYIKPGT